MGNRAVVCFDQYTPDAIGVYLHWNGGRDSIEGFLKATQRIMESRGPDPTYARARFVEACGIFFSGNLSFGLDYCKNLDCDNFDNGVYVIDSSTLEIIERHHHSGTEQSGHDSDGIADMIINRIKAADKIEK